MTKETLIELEKRLDELGSLTSRQIEGTFRQFHDNPWKAYFKKVRSIEAKIKRRKNKLK
jgi:hypothetical protein